MSTFKPMLAAPADLDNIKFPVYASAKLDGIRATVVDGDVLSRSLKLISNHAIAEALSSSQWNGLDGELIVGPATDKDVYNKTTRGVNKRIADAQAEFDSGSIQLVQITSDDMAKARQTATDYEKALLEDGTTE